MPTDKDSHLQHISARFNSDLAAIRQDLLAMGEVVEQQLQDALKALINNDGELGKAVKMRDKAVDAMELAIDEEAYQLIVRRQPTASDLRLVMAVVKMVADIERIGDEAKKIAKLAMVQAQEGKSSRGYLEVRHLGIHVGRMVRDALDAFATFDMQKALAVMKEDDAVDNEYRSATRAVMTFMMEDPRNISSCLNVMWVLRALERIGDHAGNICEHVIFMVEGTDVRHSPMEVAENVVENPR
ncbi:phosphate signaling complex protein PhoU [Allohahella marinimesophila]|uniref:Phosphate-specific transport system accessory protein PhoU n=1 Tax=Allohahella marinimesophila TaxID=1054972 RepID=A0ABP7PMH2_9GAMM